MIQQGPKVWTLRLISSKHCWNPTNFTQGCCTAATIQHSDTTVVDRLLSTVRWLSASQSFAMLRSSKNQWSVSDWLDTDLGWGCLLHSAATPVGRSKGTDNLDLCGQRAWVWWEGKWVKDLRSYLGRRICAKTSNLVSLCIEQLTWVVDWSIGGSHCPYLSVRNISLRSIQFVARGVIPTKSATVRFCPVNAMSWGR